MVVPLIPLDRAPIPAKRLNPVFEIHSEHYVMLTQFLSAVAVSLLKTPAGSLVEHDTEITGTLDMLLTGV